MLNTINQLGLEKTFWFTWEIVRVRTDWDWLECSFLSEIIKSCKKWRMQYNTQLTTHCYTLHCTLHIIRGMKVFVLPRIIKTGCQAHRSAGSGLLDLLYAGENFRLNINYKPTRALTSVLGPGYLGVSEVRWGGWGVTEHRLSHHFDISVEWSGNCSRQD